MSVQLAAAQAGPGAAPPPSQSLLVRALRREPVERPPVWFMRQAGRSLPEYRELRKGRTLLEMCATPALAAEVTLQPVRRYGTDAAILFSDIVQPLAALGVDVEIKPGVGPVIGAPVRTGADVARLPVPADASPFGATADAVRLVREELGATPVIGFAGAPFTLASYLVEGGPSKAQARTRALMLSDETTWRALLERLAAIAAASLDAQLAAGVGAVQLFDSWVGTLTAAQYDRYVAPAVTTLVRHVQAAGVPCILFAVGAGHLLERFAATGVDAVGIDWRMPLDEAAARVGDGIALQGNLDPAACLAPVEVALDAARDVLARAPRRGHVFNLGHGVMPETDPDVLAEVVRLVKGER